MPLLFSYGTLREANVQLALFGRELAGATDELSGFQLHPISLGAQGAADDNSRTFSIARRNDCAECSVRGMALEVSDAELARADAYEPKPYVRVQVRLSSGAMAWVYVDSRSESAAPGT